MKNPIPALIIALAAASILPATAEEYVDRARIIEVSPIVETIRAKAYRGGHCEVEEHYSYRDDRTGEMILGGLIGGAAGSAIGKGSGRNAAAGFGALIGAQIASGDDELSGDEVLGALIGGAAGSALGKGSGKTAATAAGAIAGTVLANEMRRNSRVSGYNRRDCTPGKTLRKAITGYEVSYEYSGIQGTGVLPYRPEKGYVDVNVSIELLEDLTIDRRR